MSTDAFNQCWSTLFASEGSSEQLGYELKQKFLFLKDITPSTSNIINFGCSADIGGDEPFALMWTLKADKVVVVDKNRDSLDVLQRRTNELKEKYPHCFNKGEFEYLVADMTSPNEMSKLPSRYFDLVFCSRVLLNIKDASGVGGVKTAIGEMARVVKPSGWIVSHEADALAPYPKQYTEIFRKEGLDEPRVIKIPETINVPDFEIEYAIFKKLA